MRVTLEVIEGKDKGKRLVIDKPRTIIVGRKDDESVPLKIDDRYFSRYHFMLDANPTQCVIRDLGSRNGTLVNGIEVRQTELHDGDIISSGRKSTFIKFRVRIDPSRESEVPADDGLGAGGVSPLSRPVASMETLPIGNSPVVFQPGSLRCAIGGEPAPEDCPLNELGAARMVTYVCDKCCKSSTDKRHPVPDYEVLETLGRGSLGPVFKARRVSTGELAALKLLPTHVSSNPLIAKIFLRQMRLTAPLKHSNIVPIIEMGLAGDRLWLATELVDGIDAHELAAQHGGKIPLSDAVAIICDVLSALDYAPLA